MSYVPVDGPRQGITNRFRIDGRRNRWSFFMGCLAITILSVIASLVIILTWGIVEAAAPQHAWGIGVFFEIVMGLMGLYFGLWFLSFAAQRCHDLNWSAGYALLCLVPGVNVVLFLLLLFKVGTKGENAFGPDPRTYYEVINGVLVPVSGPDADEN